MNRLILACIVLGALAGGILWTVRPKSAPVVEQPGAGLPVQPTVEVPPQAMRSPATRPHEQQFMEVRTAVTPEPSAQPQPSTNIKPAATNVFQETAARLVSPQVSFQEKQAIWKQLGEQGQLDELITALKQGTAVNPTAAEYPAALGQAYINKIPASRDPRDPAILGLKADQCFDAALELDPSNWEARFFKAFSMSYWPAELNKAPEVIQRFNELIEQQEKTASQPHFAQTYVLLGDEYQKAGYADYARQVWQRGAALFPDNQVLGKKLTVQP